MDCITGLKTGETITSDVVIFSPFSLSGTEATLDKNYDSVAATLLTFVSSNYP